MNSIKVPKYKNTPRPSPTNHKSITIELTESIEPLTLSKRKRTIWDILKELFDECLR